LFHYFYYLNRQQKDKAEAQFLKAVEKAPDKVKPIMIAAGFYGISNEKDKAINLYKKALDLQPEDVQIRNAFAKFYFDINELDNAEAQIETSLKKRPNVFSTRMLKGELLVYKKSFAQAIELFNQLVTESPEDAAAYYFKGIAHLGNNELNQARNAFIKSIEIVPGNMKAKQVLANIYYRERSFDMAQKESEDVLAIFPGNYTSQLMLGNIYLSKKDFDNAKKAFESLINIDPHNPVGYYRMGLLNRILKKYDAAIENFNKALSINNRLIDVFANIIMVHTAKNDLKGALEKCDTYMSNVCDSPVLCAIVHNIKGGLYLAQNDKIKAENAYLEALKNYPDFLQPYYSLAKIYLSNNQEAKAISQYQSIIEKNPNQAGPHMLLGRIYEMQQQYDLSEKHYRDALKINPDFAPAANNLAYMLTEQNKSLDEALMLAKKAKEKLYEDPSVMDTLGWIYFKKGLYDSAIVEFNDSLQKQPDNSEVHYHLGMVYYKKGETTLAKKELENALKLNKNFKGSKEAEEILDQMN